MPTINVTAGMMRDTVTIAKLDSAIGQCLPLVGMTAIKVVTPAAGKIIMMYA